ncbi:MAG: stalk domain-containing protein [Clostridia bacterium]
MRGHLRHLCFLLTVTILSSTVLCSQAVQAEEAILLPKSHLYTPTLKNIQIKSADTLVFTVEIDGTNTAYLKEGDGTTTTFQLSAYDPTANYRIYINHVEQEEGTDYTIDMDSGTITFRIAPVLGAELHAEFTGTELGVGKLFLVLINSKGTKTRFPIELGSNRIALESLQLTAGTYRAYVENIVGPAVYTSTEAPLTIPKQSSNGTGGNFPISSGDQFPGSIKVNSNGTLTISIRMKPEYSAYVFYLFIYNQYGEQVKKIEINPKNPVASIKGLSLPSGTYSVGLAAIDPVSGQSAESNGSSWTVNGGDSGFSIPSGNQFPGSIRVKSNGTITLSFELERGYSNYYFYLVIANSNGKIIQKIRIIDPKNPETALEGLKLPAGTYKISLEITDPDSDQSAVSLSEIWTLTGGYPLEETKSGTLITTLTGKNFPGGITIKADGTISFVITFKPEYAEYTTFIVFLNAAGEEVRRIPVDPRNPVISKYDLQLLTGQYTLVIEIVDPDTGSYARSQEVTYTSNLTGQIVVFINGQLQNYETSPFTQNGRALVPLRPIFEALGATVDWDEKTETVTATKGSMHVKLTIGSKVAWINGKKTMLDVPAQLINHKTFVPIRFVSEALGAKVAWDGYSESIIITK